MFLCLNTIEGEYIIVLHILRFRAECACCNESVRLVYVLLVTCEVVFVISLFLLIEIIGLCCLEMLVSLTQRKLEH